MNIVNRRGFFLRIAAGGAAARSVWGQQEEGIHKGSRIIQAPNVYRKVAAIIENGKVIQPRHEIGVLGDTGVLVVGGGCAGVVAALAAARAGQKVTLVERYGCFGGLWTAGLVLIVLATHVKTNSGLTRCVNGIGDELLQRLLKIKGGIVNQAAGKRNPTSDPEATKYVMAEMLREAGVEILLHSWASNAIMEGNTIKGVVFESKSSSFAITSRVVVDATGDGDVFAAAGAEHVRHIHRIGLVHRLGNIDRVDASAAAGMKAPKMGSVTPIPSVLWVNMQGPQGDCLDVKTLTQTELDGRRAVWEKVKALQQRPGHEQVFLLDTASQLGIRASRTLKGLVEPTYQDAMQGKRYKDVVGVGGGGDFLGERSCEIPYGALVPAKLDGLLAAGRCIAADNLMMNYMRLIGPCLVSGQAAGAAAAMAVRDKRRPRDIDVPQLQGLLSKQGVYFG